MARIPLTANISLYVDPNGNDANDGLTALTPFQHIQHAYEYARSAYDFDYHGVTVRLAVGTALAPYVYNETVEMSNNFVGQGTLALQGGNGTAADASKVIIRGNSASPTMTFSKGINIGLAGGFSLENTGGGGLLYASEFTPPVKITGLIRYGAAGGSQIILDYGAFIDQIADTEIYGSAPCHISLRGNSILDSCGHTVTLTGTPNFASGFINTTGPGEIRYYGNTFVGSATGPRAAVYGALVNLAGAGANSLPGNSAASTGWGGLIV